MLCRRAAGDALAQRVEQTPFSWRRNALTALYGAGFVGPVGHTWYMGLDRAARAMFRPGSFAFVSSKVVADTAVFGPVHVAGEPWPALPRWRCCSGALPLAGLHSGCPLLPACMCCCRQSHRHPAPLRGAPPPPPPPPPRPPPTLLYLSTCRLLHPHGAV